MGKLLIKELYKNYNPITKKNSSIEYAVNGIDLECDEGDFIGLLGPSGCGKTTTLRMIAGLEEVTSGNIYLDNKVLNNVQPKDRGVGLAFEDYALYPPLNVFDNIAFCLRAKKMNKNIIKEKIDKLAPLLQIEDILYSKVGGLSGGQKQRVNIARALIRKPSLLLLDEPLSHLDGKTRQTLRTEIKRIHNEIKCTTIIVTHDQLEAMSLADKIAIMDEGKIKQFDTPYNIYYNPDNIFVAEFIGDPPMNLFNVYIKNKGGHLCFCIQESDIEIEAPKEYYYALKEDMEIKFGIRPTNISIVDIDTKNSFKAKVKVFEDLGEEKVISVKVGDAYLSIITNKRKCYKSGDEINLSIRYENMCLFNLKTGERIRSK